MTTLHEAFQELATMIEATHENLTIRPVIGNDNAITIVKMTPTMVQTGDGSKGKPRHEMHLMPRAIQLTKDECAWLSNQFQRIFAEHTITIEPSS